jgi:hypothetical protein
MGRLGMKLGKRREDAAKAKVLVGVVEIDLARRSDKGDSHETEGLSD